MDTVECDKTQALRGGQDDTGLDSCREGMVTI